MLTYSVLEGSTWTLRFALESGDPERGVGQGAAKIGFKAQYVQVELPVRLDSLPHPDAEALAVFVILRPWISARLVVSRPVSTEFADLLARVFRVAVEPVDPRLKPRAPGTVPLLSYSAGFDSTAASALMPDIPHLHHRRISHPDVPDTGNYRADAIEGLAVAARDHGRDVYVTRTDFECIVEPHPQLPHWFGFAVGPLLLADHFDAGALVLGGTLETWLMDMGRRWTGLPQRGLGIDPLPEIVGLPIMRPLVGVTEIGTMELTRTSPLASLARSCLAGTLTDACHRCAKCLRKDLIRGALGDGDALDMMPADAPGWNQFDGQPPFYMQAQFEWAAARIPRSKWAPKFAAAVAKMGSPAIEETSWMSRAYRPAVAYGALDPWLSAIEARIEEELGWMSADEVASMKAWMRV